MEQEIKNLTSQQRQVLKNVRGRDITKPLVRPLDNSYFGAKGNVKHNPMYIKEGN